MADNLFVTELDKLFFEIGQEMAKFKTPAEQQLFLQVLQKKLEEKQDVNPRESDTEETRNQLDRYYKKGFVRWGLTQNEKLITGESVKKNGKLFWYDEKKRRREEFDIPRNLRDEFQKGWESSKLKKYV